MSKFVFTGHFNIDFEKEEKRLRKCFAGEQLNRQLHLIELFKAVKLEEWEIAYSNLPYDNERECPEQEYVAMIFHEIMDSLIYRKFTVDKWEVVNG